MPRCGSCRHTEPVKEDFTVITCWGGPPSMVMVPVQTPEGFKMQAQFLNPQLQRNRRACGLYVPMDLPVVANDAVHE